MRYPQEIIEEVRSGNDIVDVIGSYIALRNRGGSFFGLCPFHNEKTPSFSVSPDKQMYHCFGCGAGGNVISFIMQIENYDFLDALKFLADRINYMLPQPQQNETTKAQLQKRDILRNIHKKAAVFFHETLQQENSQESEAARLYLEERGIAPNIQRRFGLGLSPDAWDKLSENLKNNGFKLSDMVESGLVQSGKRSAKHYDRFRGRLMFPIMDLEGHVVGFGGRVMGANTDTAKYLNSPETPLFNKSRQLYGIHATRKARHKEIILVEGYMDVISLHQAGYSQAVGVLGTALTPYHARLLKRINCNTALLLFDRDSAGVKAVLRAIPILLEAGFKVKCLQVPEDVNDPDDYIRKYGAARFGRLLETAKNHAAFRIDLLAKEYDLENTEQRISFTQEAAAVLASIDNSIEADAYIRETAKQSGIAAEAILTEMDKHRGKYSSESMAPRNLPGLRRKLQNQRDSRGLAYARKGILSVLLAYPGINRNMQAFLSPEEMGGGVASKLLSLAYESQDVREVAEIVSGFETLEEQQQVAEMLMTKPEFDSDDVMEKALNEMWRTIKRAAITEQISEENDMHVINTLGNALRNLEKQYITITNG